MGTLNYVMYVEAAISIPYFVIYTFKCCITYSTNKYFILYHLFYSYLLNCNTAKFTNPFFTRFRDEQ